MATLSEGERNWLIKLAAQSGHAYGPLEAALLQAKERADREKLQAAKARVSKKRRRVSKKRRR